jgi:hypothetical protein
VICRRSIAIWLVVAVLGACSGGSGKAPGLKDAGPVVATFAQAGKALDGLGAAIARRPVEDDKVPFLLEDKLRELGTTARRVLDRAEPTGPAGVAAVQKELAAATTDVIRHLVMTAGGTADGPNNLVSSQPEQLAFRINVSALPLQSDRSAKGKVEGRSRLKGDLSLEIEHFIYTALLANPASRAKLAPRLSPADLPKVPDPELNLNAETTDEWRQQLFDTANRVVVPSPFQVSEWKAFLSWAESVNPTIRDSERRLTQIAFNELFY